MHPLDVNVLTDTKPETVPVSKQKNYIAPNGKSYYSEAEYVKTERKGE